MKILTAFGKDSTFTIGYMTDKICKDHKCISLVFIEVFWSNTTKRWGLGIGIPFVASVGIVF
jgi:hypothetical protein